MWLAEKFEHLPPSLPFRPPAAVEVKEGSFPHLLDQLNQLAKGQHRARPRWVLLERPLGGDHFPDPAEAGDPGLPLLATEGNYIAALKPMALRLTAQSDAHRANRLDRRCLHRITSSMVAV